MNLELKVSAEEAKGLLRSLEIDSFNESYDKYWREENGRAYFSSVCWLYCWGATKLGCQKTTDMIRDVFDKLFHFSFDEFGKGYSLVIIGNCRYKGYKEFPGHNAGYYTS
ncbi:hypothetical protein PM10SUCC1_11890 [Propionigenium maris DSM 9537]|uniref:Uncharacterized protein n=1 Tax=Propionigenium maris DSM 9537 TaxID=1123000 RepID=A0A9W6GK75_9FUSO|nr:hypothetical protein [Propionigenium maris]GLI55675.1 hypothetical protein PM10SUCC1_11890 [Propionigenium maris DSM 9537]